MNADAFADIVVGDIEDGSIRIFFADGSGGFQPETTINTPQRVVVWSAADLNGDGLADLLTQEGAPDATTTVLRAGNGTGGFAAPGVDSALGPTAGAVTVGDVNGDGRPDSLAVRHPSRATVAVQLGNGTGTFAGPIDFLLPHFIDLNGELEDLDDEFGWPFRPVVVADLNLDRRMDIAAGDGTTAVQVLLQRLQRSVIRSQGDYRRSADPVAEAGPFNYTVTVANLGPADVSGATLAATLPWMTEDNTMSSSSCGPCRVLALRSAARSATRWPRARSRKSRRAAASS